MNVIMVRYSNSLPEAYFCGLRNGHIDISRNVSNAMLFTYEAEAHIMIGLIQSLIYNLELRLDISSLPTDLEYEVNDSVWFDSAYSFVDQTGA